MRSWLILLLLVASTSFAAKAPPEPFGPPEPLTLSWKYTDAICSRRVGARTVETEPYARPPREARLWVAPLLDNGRAVQFIEPTVGRKVDVSKGKTNEKTPDVWTGNSDFKYTWGAGRLNVTYEVKGETHTIGWWRLAGARGKEFQGQEYADDITDVFDVERFDSDKRVARVTVNVRVDSALEVFVMQTCGDGFGFKAAAMPILWKDLTAEQRKVLTEWAPPIKSAAKKMEEAERTLATEKKSEKKKGH